MAFTALFASGSAIDGNNHCHIYLTANINTSTFAPNVADFLLTENGVPMFISAVALDPDTLPNCLTVTQNSAAFSLTKQYMVSYGHTTSVIQNQGAGESLSNFSLSMSTHAIMGPGRLTQSGDDATQGDDDNNFSIAATTNTVRSSTVTATRRNVGLRFVNVPIPQGSTILTANLSVVAASVSTDDVLATIYGDAADISAVYTIAGATDINNRTKTSASMPWSATSLGTALVPSPEIKTIVQEIVNRPAFGSVVGIIIEGDNSATDRTLAFNAWDSQPNHIYLNVTWVPPIPSGGGGIASVQLPSIGNIHATDVPDMERGTNPVLGR